MTNYVNDHYESRKIVEGSCGEKTYPYWRDLNIKLHIATYEK